MNPVTLEKIKRLFAFPGTGLRGGLAGHRLKFGSLLLEKTKCKNS